MPPPSDQRADIEPPPQVMYEATKGFFTGAIRFGSLSILAHLILSLPHPMTPGSSSSAPTTTTTSTSASTYSSSSSNVTGNTSFKTRIYSPLVSVSRSMAPMSRVYRGLTPQFKVFIQMGFMTLGACIWAERRVAEYLGVVRKMKRAERRERERDGH
ncbi:hypothetical protein FQN57_001215 [Myotisia sp. PD_48]|nr:hypothetical protein FQN57_001215 [Myotisia sp. PD_48]